MEIEDVDNNDYNDPSLGNLDCDFSYDEEEDPSLGNLDRDF